MTPCIYRQPVFDIGIKNTQRRKDSVFDKWCWENGIVTRQRRKLDSWLIHTKMYLKSIRDFSVRPETIKLLEGYMTEKLLDTGSWPQIPGYDPRSTGNKIKKKQVGLRVTKQLLHTKETTNEVTRQLIGWEKICANRVSVKGFISKI